MKLSAITIIAFLCLASTTFAYDYVIDSGYTPGFTLHDSETLLMTGGGAGGFDLENDSAMTIQGTSALDRGYGGVWDIMVGGVSRLDISGGEINEITMVNSGTATLSGGLIVQIHSSQSVWQWDYSDPEFPVYVFNPHIEVLCRDWTWHEPSNILTGTWPDYSTFDIMLYDYAPNEPAIENIKFTIVPEPFSLLLLSLGGTLLTRRRR